MNGRRAVTMALAIGGVVACGHSTSASRPANPAEAPASLNGLTAAHVVDEFTKAGLPTVNRRDVTSAQCPKVNCVQAVSTDTVSVFKFPATGIGQRFTEGQPSVYQIEDLVLTFAPGVSDDLKNRYERVVERAAV